MDKERGFMNIPFILIGTDYYYLKFRMVAFIKSMDNKAWKVMVKGWDPPMILGPDGKVTNMVKAEKDWDDKDEKELEGNSKSFNTLFNGVDKNIFRLISNCTIDKEALDILKTTHEGTSKVKMSRIQLLTT
ncbi:unnamed protein product [Vicia faba]|uniref:Gag-pol polyprotein n=1 Tax=Vicia faba TaxID=3906 RepID=A0AAV0Z8C5_VICFA|nr:unnamed protein product [Vicia faba]